MNVIFLCHDGRCNITTLASHHILSDTFITIITHARHSQYLLYVKGVPIRWTGPLSLDWNTYWTDL